MNTYVSAPHFALIGPHGDTAAVLRETGGAQRVPSDDADAIAEHLLAFIHALLDGQAPRACPAAVTRHSRREGAALLADMLHQVTA